MVAQVAGARQSRSCTIRMLASRKANERLGFVEVDPRLFSSLSELRSHGVFATSKHDVGYFGSTEVRLTVQASKGWRAECVGPVPVSRDRGAR